MIYFPAFCFLVFLLDLATSFNLRPPTKAIQGLLNGSGINRGKLNFKAHQVSNHKENVMQFNDALGQLPLYPSISLDIEEKAQDRASASVVDQLFKKFGNRGPDFEPNLGKVIDTLNTDYPNLFEQAPNFEIFTPDIEVRDPSGVQFRGKNVYKQLFGLLRFFRGLAMGAVEIRHKLVYDVVNQQVRVTWYTRILLKGSNDPLYVDGISVYSISDEGFVFSHHVEKIIVNGIPAVPPYGIRWIDIQQALKIRYYPGDVGVPAVVPMPTITKMHHGEKEELSKVADSKTKNPKMIDWPFPKINPPQTCEDSYDCDFPQNCCDFIAFKMCCNGGLGVGREFVPELVPIPIPVEDPYRRY